MDSASNGDLPAYISPVVSVARPPAAAPASAPIAARAAAAPIAAGPMNETLVLNVTGSNTIQRVSPLMNGLETSTVLDVQAVQLNEGGAAESSKRKHAFNNGISLLLRIPAAASSVTVSAMWADAKTGEMTSMKRNYAFNEASGFRLGEDRQAKIALVLGKLDGLTVTTTLVYA